MDTLLDADCRRNSGHVLPPRHHGDLTLVVSVRVLHQAVEVNAVAPHAVEHHLLVVVVVVIILLVRMSAVTVIMIVGIGTVLAAQMIGECFLFCS